VVPPYGIGSLGVHTPTGADKSAFGNQVDFLGEPIADLTDLSYWVFTTQENIAAGGTTPNLPSLQFEIDPNLASTPSPFSTLSFIPPQAQPGEWTEIDLVNSGGWVLSGAAGTATGCALGVANCTWEEVQTALDDGGEGASIYTVQFTNGRDFAFSGAVDGLRMNDDVYDFEPFGVSITTP
jgi:hypothetical protein